MMSYTEDGNTYKILLLLSQGTRQTSDEQKNEWVHCHQPDFLQNHHHWYDQMWVTR